MENQNQTLPNQNSASVGSQFNASAGTPVGQTDSRYYPIENLESPSTSTLDNTGSTNSNNSSQQFANQFTPSNTPPPQKSRNKLRIFVIIVVISLLLTGIVGWRLISRNMSRQQGLRQEVPEQTLQVDGLNNGLAGLSVDAASSQVLVNGNIVTSGSVYVADDSGSFAEITVDGLDGNQTFTLPNTSGTVCLDSNNCGFALAADIDNPTSTVINNLAGTVSIQGTTNQINVATAGNAVVLSLPQSLATTSSPTFNSITLTGTGLQNGNVLCDISNNCGYAGGTNSFVQGGNSFGATAILGTNDNFGLSLETNGTARLNIDTSGKVEVVSGAISSPGPMSFFADGFADLLLGMGNLSGVPITFMNSAVMITPPTGVGAGLTVRTAGGLTPVFSVDTQNNVVVVGNNSIIPAGFEVGTTLNVNGSNCNLGCWGMYLVSDLQNTINTSNFGAARLDWGITPSAVTLANGYGLYIGTPTLGAGSAVTNNYGILVQAQTAGTNDYGIAVSVADTQTLWIGNAADSTTANAGIAFGLSRDTNLYRSAANTLRTDDVLSVGTLGTTNTAGYLCYNSSSQLAGCSTTGTGVAFVQGGNSFGETAVLGTNDANSLAFEVNNATVVTVEMVDPGLQAYDINSLTTFDGMVNIGNGDFSVDGALPVLYVNSSYQDVSTIGMASLISVEAVTEQTLGAGGWFGAYGAGSQDFTILAGSVSQANYSGSGTAEELIGSLVVTTATASNTVLYQAGLQVATEISESTVTELYGIDIESFNIIPGSSVADAYGINVGAQTGATASYGIAVGVADTQTLWVGSSADSTTANAGIAFGQSRDTNLYRSAANTLRTDDLFSTGGQVSLVTEDQAIDSFVSFEDQLSVGSGATLTVSNDGMLRGIVFNPTIVYDDPFVLTGGRSIEESPILTNPTGVAKTMPHQTGFYASATIQGDGALFTTSRTAFLDPGNYTTINGGSVSAINHVGFGSALAVGSGTTILDRRGIDIENAAGAGSVTDQYGIYVRPLTKGTNDYGIRVDASDTQTLWISGNANNTTAAAGIAFGSSRDTNLYRSAADTLRTSDTFIADTRLAINSTTSAGTDERLRVNTPTTIDNDAVAVISAGDIDQHALVVQGAAGQTANLQEWQNSSGTALAFIEADGDIEVEGATVNSDLTVLGSADITGNLDVGTITTGDITLNGHLITGNDSGSTTAVAGADAGAGAIVPHAGNDVSGSLVVTTGTGSTTGELAEITFGSAYGIAPRVVITPRDSNAATLDYYVTSTTTTFTIHTASAPTDSQSYGFSYHVMQ